MIRDIVEPEEKGTSVMATAVAVEKPTTQQVTRTRGPYKEGRYVPSKQLKAAHRRARSNLSLKQWARVNGGKAATDWMRGKAS